MNIVSDNQDPIWYDIDIKFWDSLQTEAIIKTNRTICRLVTQELSRQLGRQYYLALRHIVVNNFNGI